MYEKLHEYRLNDKFETDMAENTPQIELKILPVTPLQQNCSLLWDKTSMEGVLIDPGGEAERLIKDAKELGVTIKEIWLTHGHLDHAGGAKDIREATGAVIIGPHKDDQFWLDQIEASWAKYGMAGMGKDVTPDRYLEEGDVLKLGDVEFSVVHTPGHTPGHVVIFNQELKIAFVGDVLFRGSVGRTDFPRSNPQDLIKSIRHKLWPLGNDMRFIPGHGPASTFGQERADNPFVGDQVIDRMTGNTGGVM